MTTMVAGLALFGILTSVIGRTMLSSLFGASESADPTEPTEPAEASESDDSAGSYALLADEDVLVDEYAPAR